jgi:hypothetical protein
MILVDINIFVKASSAGVLEGRGRFSEGQGSIVFWVLFGATKATPTAKTYRRGLREFVPLRGEVVSAVLHVVCLHAASRRCGEKAARLGTHFYLATGFPPVAK